MLVYQYLLQYLQLYQKDRAILVAEEVCLVIYTCLLFEWRKIFMQH